MSDITDDTQDIPIIELRDWYYVVDDEEEEVVTRLCGKVFGDPRRADGKHVVTTRIVKAEGRLITTRGGSKYRLTTIEAGFRKHLDAVRPLWDPENPIEMGGVDA